MEYVDLGLSVCWGTCNLGAAGEDEFGDYLSWGELSPKCRYDWDTYRLCDGSENGLTVYSGHLGEDVTLCLEDDLAAVSLGEGWRLPTIREWKDLAENCTMRPCSIGGHAGYRFESKVPGFEGRSIFIPSGGMKYAGMHVFAGKLGRYWSSSRDKGFPKFASCMLMTEQGTAADRYLRCNGLPVRPVFSK